MLEQNDLDMIQKMMQEMIVASEERTAQRTAALMDLEFRPQFNLLAESVAAIMEKLDIEPRVSGLETDVSALKAAVRANREDIDILKEAM